MADMELVIVAFEAVTNLCVFKADAFSAGSCSAATAPPSRLVSVLHHSRGVGIGVYLD